MDFIRLRTVTNQQHSDATIAHEQEQRRGKKAKAKREKERLTRVMKQNKDIELALQALKEAEKK